MRIVIVGAGQVGFHLAAKLSKQGQDVTVVDADPERGEYLRDRLRRAVRGRGVRAGAARARSGDGDRGAVAGGPRLPHAGGAARAVHRPAALPPRLVAAPRDEGHLAARLTRKERPVRGIPDPVV
ncbi:NAD-binding protein [Candidatus Palauibacter sp.]|uniref:NAD-binding protein n=1 Tax=Candidatus Palauibacter sp. TaxID=3101350 RepID=UPI003B52F4DA